MYFNFYNATSGIKTSRTIIKHKPEMSNSFDLLFFLRGWWGGYKEIIFHSNICCIIAWIICQWVYNSVLRLGNESDFTVSINSLLSSFAATVIYCNCMVFLIASFLLNPQWAVSWRTWFWMTSLCRPMGAPVPAMDRLLQPQLN